jgi:signal transduction histidine kinase
MFRGLARAKLRTQVLLGVLGVTLISLAGFDVAAVTGFRSYLIGETESNVTAEIRPVFFLPASLRSVPPHPEICVDGGHVCGPQFMAITPSVLARQQRANHLLQTRIHADAVRLPIIVNRAVGHSVGELWLTLVIASAVVGILVFLGVTAVVRRGLRPIETMAAQADKITAGDLTDRVNPEDPVTEVGRLGAALNGMLGRIESSVAEREASQEVTRRFFADASHELRTPLASLRANAELYQQGALLERPQIDEAMRRIRLEARRMGRLVDDMLRLARLDQPPGQHFDLVDLTAVVTGCCDRARITDPARTWHAKITERLEVVGDSELLRRAIDNLLANVSAHTPDGTVATIAAATRGNAVVIEVSDNGPGVPAGELSQIFERFYRARTPSHRPGSGLGLAIVAAIASTHHGTAQAALSSPHGLRVSLTLPAARPQLTAAPTRAEKSGDPSTELNVIACGNDASAAMMLRVPRGRQSRRPAGSGCCTARDEQSARAGARDGAVEQRGEFSHDRL